MKSIITSKHIKQEAYFPKLMVAKDGLVVLFKRTEIGVVVHAPDGCWMMGDHSDGWYMEEFTDFTGSITLSND